MRHATDADHVIAVSTIVSRERSIRSAAWIGAIWGLGHSLTVIAVGGVIILFGVVIPARLGLSLEFSVAVMLIVLGLWNLKGIWRWFEPMPHVHSHHHAEYMHSHAHDDDEHRHEEDETPGWLDRRLGVRRFYQALRPLVVGVVHGLAGSAAVSLLVLPIIHDPLWAAVYLVLFGAGTIVGMMLITAAIALPVSYTAARSILFHRRLALASGLLSVGFGLYLIYEVGFLGQSSLH